MTGADIIVAVVVSFFCLIFVFGIFALIWLWVAEIKYQWQRHQGRKVRSRRSPRL